VGRATETDAKAESANGIIVKQRDKRTAFLSFAYSSWVWMRSRVI